MIDNIENPLKINLWGCSSRQAGTTPSPQLSIEHGIGSKNEKKISYNEPFVCFLSPSSSVQKSPFTDFGPSLSKNAHYTKKTQGN